MSTHDNMTTEYVLRAVADALKHDVLPALEQANWPAGNVRACLSLLAYAEDRVRNEGRMLHDSNAKLSSLLEEIASGKGMPHDAALTNIAAAVLKKFSAQSTSASYVGIAEMTEAHNAYQAAVTALIKQSHARRSEFDATQYQTLRAKLSECAAICAAPDDAYTETALGLTPI